MVVAGVTLAGAAAAAGVAAGDEAVRQFRMLGLQL